MVHLTPMGATSGGPIYPTRYFRNRLSTRSNLLPKHIVDDDTCQRCWTEHEDRCHVFFSCVASAALWSCIGFSDISMVSDDAIWDMPSPAGLDQGLWLFVLLTILWRLWDAKNGEVFRQEASSHRSVLSRVCDDLVVWRKRLRPESVTSLKDWRDYLLSCNATAHPVSLSGVPN